MKKLVYALLALIVFATLFLKVSRTAEANSLELVPAHPDTRNPKSFTYLYISAKAGDEVKGEFAAVNLSDSKVELKFTPSDASVNDKGEIAGGAGQTTEVGGWLTVPDHSKENVLGPKERKNFPFSVKIPFAAKPGEYVGAIMANDTASLPVWIKVEGEAFYNFSIVSFKDEVVEGMPTFRVVVKNAGNTVVNSVGFKIDMTNHLGIGLGRNLSSFFGEDSAILPGGQKEFLLPYENSLPALGKYDAHLTVSIGKNTKESNLSFSFFNMKAMGGFILQMTLIIIILSGFVYGIFKLRRKISEMVMEKKLNTNILSENKNELAFSSTGDVTGQDGGNPDFSSGVRKIALEEGNMSLMKEDDYDRLWFRVRKIVREEIELWKEMEKFRKDMKKEIKEEMRREKKQNSAS